MPPSRKSKRVGKRATARRGSKQKERRRSRQSSAPKRRRASRRRSPSRYRATVDPGLRDIFNDYLALHAWYIDNSDPGTFKSFRILVDNEHHKLIDLRFDEFVSLVHTRLEHISTIPGREEEDVLLADLPAPLGTDPVTVREALQRILKSEQGDKLDGIIAALRAEYTFDLLMAAVPGMAALQPPPPGLGEGGGAAGGGTADDGTEQ